MGLDFCADQRACLPSSSTASSWALKTALSVFLLPWVTLMYYMVQTGDRVLKTSHFYLLALSWVVVSAVWVGLPASETEAVA